MKKTVADRIKELAKRLDQKAEELRQQLEGVETNVYTTANKRFSKQGKK